MQAEYEKATKGFNQWYEEMEEHGRKVILEKPERAKRILSQFKEES